MTKKKAAPRSRRVSWPGPNQKDEGEFRLTWGRIAAGVAMMVALVGAVPTYWTISDHWMNRKEIQTMMKEHADHDASAQAWTTYGFAQNRVEYLDDKLAECQLRTATHAKLDPVEAGICTRYESKYKMKTDEANQLRSKAVEAARERPPAVP